jgi:cholesterol oxidase
MNFDVIVIGSGFGGAISGCRLAEAGYKVLILERGRRWDKSSYPREPLDPWIWSNEHPELENGWLDLRVFPHMAVAQGAAVGGGSLIYASVSVKAPDTVFESGWPAEITASELAPHYDRVARFMNVQRMPDNQWNPRTHLMKDAADAIGQGSRFKMLELAVSFDPDLTYDPHHPPGIQDSKQFQNAQGVTQGYCIHAGTCDIGCPVYAKNTLDLNYIPWAEKHGAEVRPLHVVRDIAPVEGGYRVSFDRLDGGHKIAGSETARLVIVAAGSLGSTELLLQCRDLNQSLPLISRRLGANWSSNGDFLTPAIYANRALYPDQGPTIASAIDFLDRSDNGQSFWVEDGGFPHILGSYLMKQPSLGIRGLHAQALIAGVQGLLRDFSAVRNVMPWFAQGVDAGNGVLSLQPQWGLPGRMRLDLQWDISRSRPLFDTVVAMHQRLSMATGGLPILSPGWLLSHDLITPHPLGGCNIGQTTDTGVVGHNGEVFNYRNLYVADAASIPTPLGVNPSRTIGALAERLAEIIIKEGR